MWFNRSGPQEQRPRRLSMPSPFRSTAKDLAQPFQPLGVPAAPPASQPSANGSAPPRGILKKSRSRSFGNQTAGLVPFPTYTRSDALNPSEYHNTGLGQHPNPSRERIRTVSFERPHHSPGRDHPHYERSPHPGAHARLKGGTSQETSRAHKHSSLPPGPPTSHTHTRHSSRQKVDVSSVAATYGSNTTDHQREPRFARASADRGTEKVRGHGGRSGRSSSRHNTERDRGARHAAQDDINAGYIRPRHNSQGQLYGVPHASSQVNAASKGIPAHPPGVARSQTQPPIYLEIPPNAQVYHNVKPGQVIHVPPGAKVYRIQNGQAIPLSRSQTELPANVMPSSSAATASRPGRPAMHYHSTSEIPHLRPRRSSGRLQVPELQTAPSSGSLRPPPGAATSSGRASTKHRPHTSESHIHTAGNAAQPAGFQYSKCTGKKKAVCVGINYYGQKYELKGCINDAKRVKDFLIRYWNYKEENIWLLTDDATNPRQIPTRRNMIDAIRWLVDGACAHDSLLFHYSGHGSQTPDLDGDEADGYDEVIFPVDHEANGFIIDDFLHDIMVKPLPSGCRLTAIFDSCHSGTALDLPYIYRSNGKLKASDITASWLERKKSPADVISFSACTDDQTSADTFSGKVAVGAMSNAFIAVLKANPHLSYRQLLISIREVLKKRYSQKPQLSGSHEIDTNLQFIM